MKTVFHPANQRGYMDYGWLKSHHSFSFGDFYQPKLMGFGLLRVINDDIVAGGKGFGEHPHRDMEIISIPLSGSLAHKDSEGNASTIHAGDVQIMSAGTGILHSEFNASKEEIVNFLQIWIHTRERGSKPRYEQKRYSDPKKSPNQWQSIVSPEGSEHGVAIQQDAYLALAYLEAGQSISYQLHNPQHGVYIFLLDGEVEIAGQNLLRKDAMGLWECEEVTIRSQQAGQLLAIEVPMK